MPTGDVWYYREPSGPMDPGDGGRVPGPLPAGRFSRDPDQRRTTGGRHIATQDRRGGGRGSTMVVATVVVVVVAVIVVAGAVLLRHKSDSSGAAPPGSTSKTVKKPASSTPAGPVYTLSTPATAGGYPTGQDPIFLGEATTTAKSLMSGVASGGGGKAQGTPVSASYNLGDEQVMEFVGYQGSFTPAKVALALKSFGTSPAAYPTGPHGGVLDCVNTSATPSGAVCVWSTTSTIGVVEFFDAFGPETLTQSQAKGAADTLALRSGVETVKPAKPAKSAKS